ncbi:hypothetical protein WMO79_00850 [Micrococcaceae bacterium Sec7.4]
MRENSPLNLTQSKALTDLLLAEHTVTAKPPVDRDTVPVEVGQIWRHEGTERTVRVTNVELGPQYVANDPVTSWGPERVSWRDTEHPTAAGTVQVRMWRRYMVLLSEDGGTIPAPGQPSTHTSTPTEESETPA